MIFRKKKRMIDVRELQRRGVVRIPKQDVVIPTDRDGFVEFGSGLKSTNPQTTSPSSNTEFFGFMNSTSPASTNRAESERISELDNKIYKLENRIELLEKKLDINQSSEPSVGVMGW